MDPWLLLPRRLLFIDTLRPRNTAAVCSGSRAAHDLRAPCRLLWVSRCTRGDHHSALRQTSAWSHFPPAHLLRATPFRCPRSRTATLEIGSRGSYLPDCTLSRLRAQEYDLPVTHSIATPEPSSRTIPTLDRALVTRKSLKCVTTSGSRRSCPG